MNFSRQHFPQFGRNGCPGPSSDRPGRARQILRDNCQSESHAAGNTLSGTIPVQRISRGAAILVEGDAEIRGMLRFFLETEGYDVSDLAASADALDSSKASQATTILLSLDVIDSDSMAELRELRLRTQAHIIVLSSVKDEALMIRALDAGANDCLIRPLSLAELAARLRVARRSIPAPASVFKVGELTLDLSSRAVTVSGRAVKLTATEFSLLSLFVRNAGKVLPYAQILTEVWGPRMSKKLEYLRVYLKSLRDKIETTPDFPRLLLTERFVGYRLAVPGD